MDTAKVIPSPAGGYLAVYHSDEVCHLATSADLMTWTHRAVIDEPATQPTIASTGDGGLLTAAEFNDGHGGRLRVRYWPTLEALLAGRPAREFLAPRTLSACNEGTPSIRRIGLDADLDASMGRARLPLPPRLPGRPAGPRHPDAASGPGPRPGTRSWTRPSSGPPPRSASRSAATSATVTTCATSAGTTTWSRPRGAGATSPPGGSTSTTGRPGPPSGWRS